MFIFHENALNLGILTRTPSHSNPSPSFYHHPHPPDIIHCLWQNFFENNFSPNNRKGCRKLWFVLSNFNKKNMKMTWNIRVFVFHMICYFFKCNGLTKFLRFCKNNIYRIKYAIVLILLFLLCNHDNLILKLYQKK